MLHNGNGEITSSNYDTDYRIHARFANGTHLSFTCDGKQYINDSYPSLFYGHDIFNDLPDSCFEPPERLPELEVDAMVWVRFADEWQPRHFKEWDGKTMVVFADGWTSHSIDKTVGSSTIACGSWSLTDPKESE